MSSIDLSVLKQQNLQTLKQNSDLINKTSERLATGKRVNGPQDDPQAYFVSSGIDSRGRELDNLLDGMSKAKSHLSVAEKGLESISKLLDSAVAVLNRISPEDNADARAAHANNYNSILRQIESVAKDSDFDNKNLLGGAGNTLSIYLAEENKAILTVKPVNFTQASDPDGLNLQNLSGLELATDADVDDALNTLSIAKASVARTGKNFAAQFRSVQDREGFTSTLSKALASYSTDLVIADTNEEGAKLLALQTKQQLASTSLSIANQSEEYVLQLFS